MHNLESGIIAVELTCYEGHHLVVLSGNDIDVTGPATV
uniref:Uncharacterized protein n=1 Tax=Nonomuraea gerenzanensis TaxID=93944 RepID=A0A1M4EL77_9ACTN|nr:hypothetical protein BN4615_P9125 [Nonomuraea gerenzanensis]